MSAVVGRRRVPVRRAPQGVFRYLCRIVGRTETARDLTQEVFLRVSRRRRARGGRGGTARVGVQDRAQSRAESLARHAPRGGPVELVDAAEPAVQELGAAIRQALARCRSSIATCSCCARPAGLSYDEIAGACELRVEAVRARLKRARQQLREALAGPIDVHRNRPVRCGDAGHEDRGRYERC